MSFTVSLNTFSWVAFERSVILTDITGFLLILHEEGLDEFDETSLGGISLDSLIIPLLFGF